MPQDSNSTWDDRQATPSGKPLPRAMLAAHAIAAGTLRSQTQTPDTRLDRRVELDQLRNPPSGHEPDHTPPTNGVVSAQPRPGNSLISRQHSAWHTAPQSPPTPQGNRVANPGLQHWDGTPDTTPDDRRRFQHDTSIPENHFAILENMCAGCRRFRHSEG
jgi:hypothetical protein